jgi:hypothetical protein
MDTTRILVTSFLVVVWWIAIWGLIEIVLKKFIGTSETNYVIAYCLMIVFVIAIVYTYPTSIERFF